MKRVIEIIDGRELLSLHSHYNRMEHKKLIPNYYAEIVRTKNESKLQDFLEGIVSAKFELIGSFMFTREYPFVSEIESLFDYRVLLNTTNLWTSKFLEFEHYRDYGFELPLKYNVNRVYSTINGWHNALNYRFQITWEKD